MNLQQSASPRREIAALIEELEELCAKAERALVALQWDDVHAAIAEQRRVTQALVNAMEANKSSRTEAFDKEVLRHIERIYAVRDNQLRRMMSYRDKVRERLRLIARAKQARRTFGTYSRSGSAGLNLLR